MVANSESRTGLLQLPGESEGSALNERTLARLESDFEALAAQPEVERICLAGGEAIFLAGADVRFFVRCLIAGDIERILRFTASAQDFLRRLSASPKPVIARVCGQAIGAGVEIALACRGIVAAPSARFSLPETGLGIYPGMGGTQRLPRRIGAGLARWMIHTGSIVPAARAKEIGLADAICEPDATADDVANLGFAAGTRTPGSDSVAALAQFFGAHRVAELVDAGFPPPVDPQLVRALVQLRTKAPLALAAAERLIDESSTGDLETGLAAEFAGLKAIFATEDARAGLLSLGKAKPDFTGR